MVYGEKPPERPMNFLSFFAKNSVFCHVSRYKRVILVTLVRTNSRVFIFLPSTAKLFNCVFIAQVVEVVNSLALTIGIVIFLIRSCIVLKLDSKKKKKMLAPYFSDSRDRDVRLSHVIPFIKVYQSSRHIRGDREYLMSYPIGERFFVHETVSIPPLLQIFRCKIARRFAHTSWTRRFIYGKHGDEHG